MHANLRSDHFPLIMTVKLKLKNRKPETTQPRTKYKPANEEEAERYNKALSIALDNSRRRRNQMEHATSKHKSRGRARDLGSIYMGGNE